MGLSDLFISSGIGASLFVGLLFFGKTAVSGVLPDWAKKAADSPFQAFGVVFPIFAIHYILFNGIEEILSFF
jgi:hypothetical protein